MTNPYQTDMTDGAIRESDVPAGIRRFPRQGVEHSREYCEFFVDCSGPGGPYGPARGRAVGEKSAIAGYEALMERLGNKLADVAFTVREIVEMST